MATGPAHRELRRWVDGLGATLWVADASWRCSFVSRGAEALLGFPLERWTSGPLLAERLPRTERERVLAAWRRLLARGGRDAVEHHLVSADGRERWCRTEVQADPESGELIGLTTDLSALAAERRTADAFVHSFDGAVWESDAGALECNYVSPQAEQIFGYPLAEWSTPGFWAERLHPEDRAATIAACEVTAREGLPHRLEYRFRAATGAYLWIQDFVSPSFEEGRPVRLHGLMVDISARKRAEEERLRYLSLLRATLESTADGILVVGTDGRIEDYNRKFAELWRMPEEALRNRDDALALALAREQLENPEEFLSQVRELYGRPEAESFDVLRLADGRVFERYSKPQRLDDHIVGRVWSFRDVTERRRAEAERDRLLALEREKQQRTAILADAGRALAHATDYPSAIAAVLGIAVPRLADWALLELDGEEERSRVAVLHADPLQAPIARELEGMPPPPPDGAPEVLRERRPVIQWDMEREGMAVWGRRGEAFGRVMARLQPRSSLAVPLVVGERLLGSLTLLSHEERHFGPGDAALVEDLGARSAMALERAWLHQQTREAVRLRDEFLSIASHELRTPCTALLLGLQGMERRIAQGTLAGESPAALRQRLEAAERQTRHLVQLIDQLLDVSRLSAGRLHLEPDRVDLAQLTRELVADFGEALARSGSSVVLHADAPVEGQWDRARLEQVVTNLLSNAVKYGAGSLIEISVEAAGPLARLEVTDHGIGIPHAQQTQVFERFARAVSARHYGGLGLGLYIVRQIVSAFGGSIRLWSEPGVGTTFTLELPLAPATASLQREEARDEDEPPRAQEEPRVPH